jgi:uncharacterized protein (TIGR02145 family)
MLYPKQTNCSENGNINSLISSIDCRLSRLANTLFNNTVFMLNKTISGTEMFDLIQYKRILYYKQINSDYVDCFSVNQIASQVKRFTANCTGNCNDSNIFPAPPIRVTTTTTTTPCPTTTSTSTTTTTTTIKVIDCGESSEFTEGVSYPTTQSITLGSVIGTVVLDYDTQGIPDRFIVEWNGNVVIDTGYRGSNAYDFGGPSRTSFNSYLTGKIDPITLITYPNFTNYPLDGYPRVLSPEAGTAFFVKNLPTSTSATVKVYSPTPSKVWLYTLFCPATTTTSTSSTTTTTTTTCYICTQEDVEIGDQIWTKCNLNVTTYRDTTIIPEIQDPTAWANATTGAWCYYDNDPANEAIYGKLYNWYAVAGIYDEASLLDPLLRKEIAPIGYHVPSDTEWGVLEAFLGGAANAGEKIKQTELCYWAEPNVATNTAQFFALPGGGRGEGGRSGESGWVPYTPPFVSINFSAFFWTTTEFSEQVEGNSLYYLRSLSNGAANINRYGRSYQHGNSIRLIKD